MTVLHRTSIALALALLAAVAAAGAYAESHRVPGQP
jgi:hypothetical protein